MTEEDWKVLLTRIRDGKCTPFLGAGVNYRILPTGGEIAREWAAEEGFPLRSNEDLASVAQFIAVKYDPMTPKGKILERLKREPRPDFSQLDERLDCLRALAELPLPVYLTTNYDDLMAEALRHTGHKKEPRREICRWHNLLKSIPSTLGGKYQPSCANPLVFHLHGSDEFVQSLVLTEDDYLDFLVNISRSRKLLPPRIEEAFTNASLLFIGYRLRDINFRVIHRGLVQSMDGSLRSLSVTVQMSPPDDCREDPTGAEKYLTKYFDELKVRVYWGTAAKFCHRTSRSVKRISQCLPGHKLKTTRSGKIRTLAPDLSHRQMRTVFLAGTAKLLTCARWLPRTGPCCFTHSRVQARVLCSTPGSSPNSRGAVSMFSPARAYPAQVKRPSRPESTTSTFSTASDFGARTMRCRTPFWPTSWQ